MNFDSFDFVVRIFTACIILLFTGIAFIFWLTGVEHNLNYSKDAIEYWIWGILVHLALIALALLSLFPHKIESLFPTKLAYILIRIPIYSISILGIIFLIHQWFSNKN